MRRLAIIVLALASPATVLACSTKESVVFSCATTNHKVVEVCDAGDHLRYSFGRPKAKPELTFSVARSKASTDQWHGVGRYIGYGVNLPRADMTYSVYFGVDRLTDEHEIEAGIHIFKGDDLLATVICDVNTLEQNLEGIDLRDADDGI